MPIAEHLDCDVLVVGGGMSGFTVAAYAARVGKRVLVVEKGPDVGGSAILSNGFVWTAPSTDSFLAEAPDADPEFARIMVAGLQPALEWVRSMGVTTGDHYHGVLGFGIGRQVDMAGFFATCARMVEANGGWVVTNAAPDELVLEDARVVGAVVRQGRETIAVRAPWTALATGGFQASGDLVRQHIRSSWNPVVVRSNPHSAGDGIRLGTAAGAALCSNMEFFYGHLLASPIKREVRESDYTALAFYHSEHGLLVNRAGRRFVDESLGDHIAAQAVAHQDGERALLICDEWIRREHVLRALLPGLEQGVDKGVLARDAGARYASAQSIDALLVELRAWGYDGDTIYSTVTEFNHEVLRTNPALEPPRKRNRMPLVEPPFSVVEVQPAITYTYGGLATDSWGRVLDEAGDPIAGLMAVGADAGGVYRVGNAGSLSRCLVFGIRAAEAILEDPYATQAGVVEEAVS